MVRHTSLAALLTLLAVLPSGCGSDNEPGPEGGPDGDGPTSPNGVEIGMSARIDDREWKAAIPSNEEGVVCAAASYDPESHILVLIGLRASNVAYQGITSAMVFVAITPFEAGEIQMGGTDDEIDVDRVAGAAYGDSEHDMTWGTDETHRGQLVIDEIDPESATLAGHFWFDGVNELGQSMKVRSGEFRAILAEGTDSRPGLIPLKAGSFGASSELTSRLADLAMARLPAAGVAAGQ